MKLYDLGISPFSARVRIVARLKNLPITFEVSPDPLRSDEFKAKFPLGKIPLLLLDDGSVIAESWVIMEYLEDAFPAVRLRPADPLACAQMRVLGRFADLYLGPALFPLFGQLTALVRDAAMVQRQLTATADEVKKLARLIESMPVLGERPLDLGDIALLATMYFVDAIPPLFESRSVLPEYPSVQRWWDRVRGNSAVSLTLGEIESGLQRFLSSIGKK